MTTARTGRLRLLAATVALVTAWLVAPHAVPLYDGLGIPDEPYRYVKPPAGYHTLPPSSATVDFPAANGTNTTARLVQTAEQTSQAGLFIVPKSLVGPATTKKFKVTVTAQAPDGHTPAGPVDGNVYRVQLWADASPTATLNPADTASMTYQQRATSASITAASLFYRPAGGAWRELPDARAGTDSFQGYFVGPGDYALVVAKAPASSSHLLVWLAVVLVLVVLAMVGAVVLIRLSRRSPART